MVFHAWYGHPARYFVGQCFLGSGVFVGVFGLSKGSGGIVIASKAADVFHGERLGKIYGFITMASGLGGALGPWWAGWLVDQTGSYTPAIVASMIMASIAITCMWLVDRPQRAGGVLSARQ